MKIVNICIGSACHLKGSYDVIEIFRSKIKENQLEDRVELNAAFCLGECTKAVSATINGAIVSISPENAEEIFEKHILQGE